MKKTVRIRSVVLVMVFTVLSCKDKPKPGPEQGPTAEKVSLMQHPNLILTKQGIKNIRANLGNVPIFDKTLALTQNEIDAEIKNGFDVPVPKDYSGGYTHETHKKNYILMQKAGALYQISNNEK